MNNKKNEMQVVHLQNHNFAIEERNGNISFNLTMMAKPFGKRTRDWLRTSPAEEYLNELSKAHKCALADLLEVRKGGTPELAGTWANDYRVAMRFAQWLDPKFSIAVDELVYKVLTKQTAIASAPDKFGVKAIIYDGKPWYSYVDIVRALGGSSRASSSRRKYKYPTHFIVIGGRNYITSSLCDQMNWYYSWRKSQLNLF